MFYDVYKHISNIGEGEMILGTKCIQEEINE